MITHTLSPVRRFVHEHDSFPAFHATYLVLTLLAAALLNLGMFAVLIAGHMVLDILKYRRVHACGWTRTVEGMLRERLTDVMLLLLGLVFSVYLHDATVLMAGMRGLMLAELTILRSMGTVLPKLFILYTLLNTLSHLEQYLLRLHPRFEKSLSLMEYVSVVSIGLSIALLLSAPAALGLDGDAFARILGRELGWWQW